MAQVQGPPSFGGMFKATAYAFGCANGGPQALSVHNTPITPGTTSLAVAFGYTTLITGGVFYPLATNAPIQVGTDGNGEIVTPSAVSANSVVYGGMNFTATFVNAHGEGDAISSASFGLQEAINAALPAGGGVVVVDAGWAQIGGTTAIIQAASLPTNGTVVVQDLRFGPPIYWANQGSGITVVSAPSAATSATVASQVGVVGTWTAITTHVLFTYVTADGGETVASADYSFTATLNLAIGGTGPAASAGAVGYKVYAGANATTTCYQAPVIAANGTVIQCGPIAAFKIGTPFSVATATVAANLIPVQNTAFLTGVQPIAAPNMVQPFASVSGPFTATGSVTSTVTEMARAALPVGALNFVGRTLRVRWLGSWTPAGTAKLILTASLTSVYPGTLTTMFTITTAASSGAAIANLDLELILCVASTGATGTVEAHGRLIYSGATGTPEIAIAIIDAVQAVSGSIDLTKQNYLVLGISSDATITTSAIRRQIVEVLA